jgi:hypothetical protein
LCNILHYSLISELLGPIFPLSLHWNMWPLTFGLSHAAHCYERDNLLQYFLWNSISHWAPDETRNYGITSDTKSMA